MVPAAPGPLTLERLRPIADELRSWDKGDAALMDLNNRGVLGICRRADGFYGPPPHRPGEPTLSGFDVALHGKPLLRSFDIATSANGADNPRHAIA